MAFQSKAAQQAYWHDNIKLMLILLSLWFLVSFGFGILLVDQLNQIQFYGFKLGFWFSQQGAIYSFLILILIYINRIAALDKKYNVEETE